jgi:hypothetical protein
LTEIVTNRSLPFQTVVGSNGGRIATVAAGPVWVAAGWLAAIASGNGGFIEPTADSTGDRFCFCFFIFIFVFSQYYKCEITGNSIQKYIK